MTEQLVFEFDNREALLHFKSWLCGSGEQSYWDWMTGAEGDEDGNITALHFDYHGPADPTKTPYERFHAHHHVKTTCGRMDNNWSAVNET